MNNLNYPLKVGKKKAYLPFIKKINDGTEDK